MVPLKLRVSASSTNIPGGGNEHFMYNVFFRLVPEVGNRKSEAKSTGGHMAKVKKQGENSACSTLFDYVYK